MQIWSPHPRQIVPQPVLAPVIEKVASLEVEGSVCRASSLYEARAEPVRNIYLQGQLDVSELSWCDFVI